MDQSTHHTETNDAQKALIQRATEVFMRLGIRSVNMADLATELSISKKTLYKFVTDKRDLILQCMDSHCTEMEEVIAGAKQDSENAIDAELKLIRFIHRTTSQMHPSVLFDLRKYHPKAFQLVVERRNGIMLGTVQRNIGQGQKEGLYRADVLPKVAATFLISLSEAVKAMAASGEQEVVLSQLYLQSALYHIRAISSPKGLAYLEEKIKKENLFA
jgi:TetR/AcrR family transcriptional regulator, cholesterol catabolism regulator